MLYHAELVLMKQAYILCWTKAGMKKRFSTKFPYRLSVIWPAGEHQRGSIGGMCEKYGKHLALVSLRQMKKTIPGDDPVKART